MTEYSSLQTKYEEEQASHTEEVSDLEKRLEALSRDKTDLAESLDLTKVQYREESSKFEDEKSLLLIEHSDKLKESAKQLVALMKEMDVNVDMSVGDDFGGLIQACKTAF